MEEIVQNPEEVDSEGLQGRQCFLCLFSSWGPVRQPTGSALRDHSVACNVLLHWVQRAHTNAQMMICKSSYEVPFFRTALAFTFWGNCFWVARACVCVHAARTWIPNCERFQFSRAGSQMLCCFNAKYSPVTSLWGQEKGLIVIFSCLVPLGLRWNKGKSDSLPSKSSYPTGSLALSLALESEFIQKAQGSS